MQDAQKDQINHEFKIMCWEQDCASVEKNIQEEKYRIEIEQARMKREIEAMFHDELELQKQSAKQDAQRNIQSIERNIHFENQTLTEQTMGQRYRLEFYKREKANMLQNQKKQQRGIALQQDAEEEYNKRGMLQQKKIKVLKDKILVLEKSL